MKIVVYILYNHKFDKFYIGQTNNLQRRLFEHNNGLTKYTRNYKGGWELIYQEIFAERNEAMAREKFLKRQKNKEFYRRLASAG